MSIYQHKRESSSSLKVWSILYGLLLVCWRCPVSCVAKNKLLNVTRMGDGDLLVYKDVNPKCDNLKAKCSTEYDSCISCKCVPPQSTFVLTQNLCMAVNEVRSFSCTKGRGVRISQAMNTQTYDQSTVIWRPIRAYKCKLVSAIPEFYSKNGTWERMENVSAYLKQGPRTQSRRNTWAIKFTTTAMLNMLLNYEGQIARINVRCTSLKDQTAYKIFCSLFKIAGTLVIDREEERFFSTDSPTVYSVTLQFATSVTSVSSLATDNDNKHDINKDSQTNGNSNSTSLILILTIVPLVIIIILVIIIYFVCRRYRKPALADQPIHLQNLESSQRAEPDVDHVYSTISDSYIQSPVYASPSNYQELGPRAKESKNTNYESLIHQVDYVDVLADDNIDTITKT